MATKGRTHTTPARPTDSELVELLPGNNPEIQLATVDGKTIADFVRGVVQFFQTALALERAAKGTLETARALRAPTTADGDERIQVFIKQASSDRRAIEQHWQICSVVSQFHRRLVALRTRGTQPLEEAAAIGNNLHNRYTEDERRRVAQEQERVRREAEERARQERDEELRRHELEAVKAEEAAPTLSEREELFVSYIMAGQTPLDAARRAGFQEPGRAGLRLMDRPKISAALKAKQEASELRRQATALKEAPLEAHVETVRPNISKAAGAHDRTTWSGEILDEAAFIDAAFAGKHGIPRDILQINQAQLNTYARSLHERLDLWPGVRAKKSTGVV